MLGSYATTSTRPLGKDDKNLNVTGLLHQNAQDAA